MSARVLEGGEKLRRRARALNERAEGGEGTFARSPAEQALCRALTVAAAGMTTARGTRCSLLARPLLGLTVSFDYEFRVAEGRLGLPGRQYRWEIPRRGMAGSGSSVGGPKECERDT